VGDHRGWRRSIRPSGAAHTRTKRGEFGIVIRRAAQGRGLGRKALALAEAYAFGELGLTQLAADIDAENQASLALFRRAGFTGESFRPGYRTTKLGVRDSMLLTKRRP
jgi:RimJ/RimL family protein N-acetyltransferase